MRGVSDIQHAFPDLPVIGSAFSYLRQYSPLLAAGMVEGGHCAFAGFGRMTLAYPDFVGQLRSTGEIDPRRVCVACGRCAALLRGGKCSGCVVRDGEVYKV
jgi:2,4-dienoyl-CoA reductase-like NADH-dependent reductase (Old Yellow Enzyme family)